MHKHYQIPCLQSHTSRTHDHQLLFNWNVDCRPGMNEDLLMFLIWVTSNIRGKMSFTCLQYLRSRFLKSKWAFYTSSWLCSCYRRFCSHSKMSQLQTNHANCFCHKSFHARLAPMKLKTKWITFSVDGNTPTKNGKMLHLSDYCGNVTFSVPYVPTGNLVSVFSCLLLCFSAT